MLLLYVAAALLVGIGAVHSVLGERYVLSRLARLEELPRLVLGGREMMVQVLRFAWHITTIAWFGMASLLILMAQDILSTGSAAAVLAGTFLLSAAVAGLASRGRHYSWMVFLAVGIIALYEAAT